ncbi:MAG: hypothetical protein M3400_16160 [Actinomycetota bacterium]|nr:hypothetical protein [Actinomycetota bacterium]
MQSLSRGSLPHMSVRGRVPALAILLTLGLGIAGCTADPKSEAASPTFTRLSAPGPGGSADRSTSPEVPATPRTPEEAVHVIALTALDLPANWTVEESPTDSNIDDDPTFLGLCDSEFRSESRRTMKVPVTGIDPQGDAVLTTEAVSYDSPDGAALALVELRGAYQNCPSDQIFTDLPVADQTGLAKDRVVVEYTLAEGTVQTVIVQRRGSMLSVMLGEARLIAFDAARKIFQRMAALTPEAAGD